ncbi:hypothetical protein HN803_05365 [candidate division WWE3 bacterium]|jgi:hypothetical protein|nr:hypothetical protein [candidate division WWE3 bacterium]
MQTEKIKKTVKKVIKKATPKKVEFVEMVRQSDGLVANVHINNVAKFKNAGYK